MVRSSGRGPSRLPRSPRRRVASSGGRAGEEARAAREAKLDAFHERLTGAGGQLVSGEDQTEAPRFAARFRSWSCNDGRLVRAQHVAAHVQGRVPAPWPSHVVGCKQWQRLGRLSRSSTRGSRHPASSASGTESPDDRLAPVGDVHAICMSLDDPLSRTANQGFFDRPTVADGSGTDAGQPFDSLFDFAVHATVLA